MYTVKNIKKDIQKKGFTLLEMLIAISMITVTFVPIIFMFSNSISLSIYSKNRMTANFLAQEAMEFIRNERNNNFIDILEGDVSTGWFDNIINCAFPDGCTVDAFDSLITPCIGICPSMKFTDNGDERKYNQTGFSDSGFTRTVYTTTSPNPKIFMYVIVKVSWKDGNRNRSEQFIEILYEWTKAP